MLRKLSVIFFAVLIAILLSITGSSTDILHAQTTVKCGEIIEGQFGRKENHEYRIVMGPLDTFTVSTKTVGDFLGIRTRIYGPLRDFIAGHGDQWYPEATITAFDQQINDSRYLKFNIVLR